MVLRSGSSTLKFTFVGDKLSLAVTLIEVV